jgi:hypothetical protein
MSVKSDKTFEEIVERLVAVFGIKPASEKVSARAPASSDKSPCEGAGESGYFADIVTTVPPFDNDTPDE